MPRTHRGFEHAKTERMRVSTHGDQMEADKINDLTLELATKYFDLLKTYSLDEDQTADMKTVVEQYLDAKDPKVKEWLSLNEALESELETVEDAPDKKEDKRVPPMEVGVGILNKATTKFEQLKKKDIRTATTDSKENFETISLNNGEDGVLIVPEKGVFAVFDGAGGMKEGALASQIARETIQQELENIDTVPTKDLITTLRNALESAFNKVVARQEKEKTKLKAGSEEREKFQMATTASIAIVRDNLLYIANVGDSPIRLYDPNRPAKERVEQISIDHSIAELIYRGASPEIQLKVQKIVGDMLRTLEVPENIELPIPKNTDFLSQLGIDNKSLIGRNSLTVEQSTNLLRRVFFLRNNMTAALGGNSEFHCSTRVVEIPQGAKLNLGSDGTSKHLSEADYEEFLELDLTPAQQSRRMVSEAAHMAGQKGWGEDDMTEVVVDLSKANEKSEVPSATIDTKETENKIYNDLLPQVMELWKTMAVTPEEEDRLFTSTKTIAEYVRNNDWAEALKLTQNTLEFATQIRKQEIVRSHKAIREYSGKISDIWNKIQHRLFTEKNQQIEKSMSEMLRLMDTGNSQKALLTAKETFEDIQELEKMFAQEGIKKQEKLKNLNEEIDFRIQHAKELGVNSFTSKAMKEINTLRLQMKDLVSKENFAEAITVGEKIIADLQKSSRESITLTPQEQRRSQMQTIVELEKRINEILDSTVLTSEQSSDVTSRRKEMANFIKTNQLDDAIRAAQNLLRSLNKSLENTPTAERKKSEKEIKREEVKNLLSMVKQRLQYAENMNIPVYKEVKKSIDDKKLEIKNTIAQGNFDAAIATAKSLLKILKIAIPKPDFTGKRKISSGGKEAIQLEILKKMVEKGTITAEEILEGQKRRSEKRKGIVSSEPAIAEANDTQKVEPPREDLPIPRIVRILPAEDSSEATSPGIEQLHTFQDDSLPATKTSPEEDWFDEGANLRAEDADDQESVTEPEPPAKKEVGFFRKLFQRDTVKREANAEMKKQQKWLETIPRMNDLNEIYHHMRQFDVDLNQDGKMTASELAKATALIRGNTPKSEVFRALYHRAMELRTARKKETENTLAYIGKSDFKHLKEFLSERFGIVIDRDAKPRAKDEAKVEAYQRGQDSDSAFVRTALLQAQRLVNERRKAQESLAKRKR